MLKIVEIVIIPLTENVDHETAGIKGIGEPGAHILCALFFGGYELCHIVYYIRYCICNIPDCESHKSYKSNVVFIGTDWHAYDFGGVFQTRTAIGANNICKNKIV